MPVYLCINLPINHADTSKGANWWCADISQVTNMSGTIHGAGVRVACRVEVTASILHILSVKFCILSYISWKEF